MQSSSDDSRRSSQRPKPTPRRTRSRRLFPSKNALKKAFEIFSFKLKFCKFSFKMSISVSFERRRSTGSCSRLFRRRKTWCPWRLWLGGKAVLEEKRRMDSAASELLKGLEDDSVEQVLKEVSMKQRNGALAALAALVVSECKVLFAVQYCRCSDCPQRARRASKMPWRRCLKCLRQLQGQLQQELQAVKRPDSCACSRMPWRISSQMAAKQ